jgi:uncharacterized protein (DUF305 family)
MIADGFHRSSLARAGVATALMVAALSGCGGAAGQPGLSGVGPAQPTAQSIPMEQVTSADPSSYTRADVDFMQGMIAHHAQAIVMTGMVSGRSSRPDVQLLARRIDMSQAEEIEIMQRWLSERGEEVPSPDDAHAHHGHHGHATLMPGMLTEEELARLAASRGPEFDRLFLEYMIRHHEGALVMVEELFASGGGQDSEMFQFASHVDGDQRIEISRMHRMLGEMP